VVGLFLRARHGEHSAGWQAGLTKIANLALAIALAAGIAVNWDVIVDRFGSWVLVASLVIIAVAVVLGRLVGGRVAETRDTTGLVAGFRFGSFGLIIIGTQLGGGADYLGPAITFALLDFLIPFALALELGSQGGIRRGRDRWGGESLSAPAVLRCRGHRRRAGGRGPGQDEGDSLIQMGCASGCSYNTY